jgi:hypothetical protein
MMRNIFCVYRDSDGMIVIIEIKAKKDLPWVIFLRRRQRDLIEKNYKSSLSQELQKTFSIIKSQSMHDKSLSNIFYTFEIANLA